MCEMGSLPPPGRHERRADLVQRLGKSRPKQLVATVAKDLIGGEAIEASADRIPAGEPTPGLRRQPHPTRDYPLRGVNVESSSTPGLVSGLILGQCCLQYPRTVPFSARTACSASAGLPPWHLQNRSTRSVASLRRLCAKVDDRSLHPMPQPADLGQVVFLQGRTHRGKRLSISSKNTRSSPATYPCY